MRLRCESLQNAAAYQTGHSTANRRSLSDAIRPQPVCGYHAVEQPLSLAASKPQLGAALPP
jgi:hypothetical protein